jgi:hypothetical protein
MNKTLISYLRKTRKQLITDLNLAIDTTDFFKIDVIESQLRVLNEIENEQYIDN